MNEELKIKITAIVDEARQAIRAVTNDLEGFQEQTDETTVSQENLSRRVKEQKQQLAQLKREYTSIVAAQGRNSAAALACSQEINLLSASYAANLASLSSASAANTVYGASAIQAAGSTRRLGTAANLSGREFRDFMQAVRSSTVAIDTEVEAASAELMRLLNQIEGLHDNDLVLFDDETDFDGILRQIEEVEGAIRQIPDAAANANVEIQRQAGRMAEGLEDVEDQAEDTEGALGKVGKGLKTAGGIIGGALKAVGAAVVGAAASIGALAESTREYRTEQAKLVTAFESAGSSAETAKKTYNDLYRVLGDTGQATEAANLLAKLTTNEQDLAEWTTIAQGAYATFGESLPIESLIEASNETAKSGEITGALADALVWAGVSEEEFAEQLFWANSEAEREKLIRTTLNGLYGEAAAGYEENAASILAANEAQAKLTESLAALGAAVEPIVTIFKAGFAEALAELVPHMTTFAQGLQDTVNGVEGGAERMKEGISGMVTSVITKVTELLPAFLSLGVDIITALLQGLAENFPAIMSAVAQALVQIITAVLESLPLLLDVIFQAAAEILVMLGEVLPEIVIKIVEILPEIIDSIVDAAPLLMEASIQFLMAIVQAIPKIIPPLLEALPQIITNILDATVDYYPALIEGAINLLMAIVDAIPDIIPPLIEALPSIIFAILGGIREAVPQMGEAANGLFYGLVAAAINIIPTLGEALAKILLSIKNGFINALKEMFKFKLELPKIKVPKFSIKPAGWEIGDLLKGVIPKLGITWNAKGGVFDKPTLFSSGGSLQGIGEDGAEAVVPLENNLEWLDKLATMLSNKLGGNNRPIILQVDGKTFARTAIDTINADTRQKGKLSLKLV